MLFQPAIANDVSYEPRPGAEGFALTVQATAYTPFEEGMTSGTGLAYDGRPALPYQTIAVDPEVIPLGSSVRVPGYGWMLAHDTGNLILGNRIDICLEQEEEMTRFGVQTMEIYVVPPQKKYVMFW
ncbi:3D domain protein [Acetonema longum DSM 6540]|uniref:3D domain protein n=2 Tax=Acetonema TaxID=2373 RepID=F7NGK2_9FIRM|nr:3D domain protein [Acetonema longum DSM 6540]